MRRCKRVATLVVAEISDHQSFRDAPTPQSVWPLSCAVLSVQRACECLTQIGAALGLAKASKATGHPSAAVSSPQTICSFPGFPSRWLPSEARGQVRPSK